MPWHEGEVSTEDGVRLWFESQGSGAPVVVPNGIFLRDDLAPLGEGRSLFLYDPRHRGRSGRHADPGQIARGILNDVDDLEAVRRHLGLETLHLVGHSYVGLMVLLYARAYPTRVARVAQIGAMGPFAGKAYPEHLTCVDAVSADVFARLERLRSEPEAREPEAFCREFWSVLREIYVANPADAHRIDWGRCHLPNERGFMAYWMGSLYPSILALRLGPEEWAGVQAPVLAIHGTKDRSAPYGGALDWVRTLPNARLLTVPDAGHAPWIEAPATVFGALRTFLDGAWPEAASPS